MVCRNRQEDTVIVSWDSRDRCLVDEGIVQLKLKGGLSALHKDRVGLCIIQFLRCQCENAWTTSKVAVKLDEPIGDLGWK